MISRDIVVYIAGPFRPKQYGQWGQTLNIRRAEKTALAVWTAGFTALCPHLNTQNFTGACDDSVWLRGDLALLDRCDAVLMVEGWETSSGAKDEKVHAERRGIPVFFSTESLNEFFEHVSLVPATIRKMFRDIDGPPSQA